MKRLMTMLGVAGLAVASFAAVDDTLISFSTPGPDKYADGSDVLAGECYALVWSADGVFEGIKADGTTVDPADKVVLLAAVAKQGENGTYCPPLLYQVDAELAATLNKGVYAVYLLDTRVTAADGAVAVGGLDENGKLKAVNSYGSVSGDTKAAAGAGAIAQANEAALAERLQTAMVKGNKDYLESDLQEAMEKYGDAVKIIEGPLMAGMNKVGELFGSGKMFLPQVVKTARTMKAAVSILQPYIESSRQAGSSAKAGKILLATVKGDVHDIGKNIVGLVLACNNYEVVDLGVMVPAEEIVRQAKAHHVDIIGLSGLITPSLEEMVNVARELQSQGLDIPLMIGGATTSELHTALKISPVYHAPILWMKDASQNVSAAGRIMGSDRADLIEELDEKNRQLIASYEQGQSKAEPLSLEEARKRKFRRTEDEGSDKIPRSE